MTIAALALSVLAAALPVQSGDGTDWPQFRGPNRDGVAADQAVLPQWEEGGPPELWRRPLGSGFSTVASVGDRLYTMAASEEHEEVLCLDARTGETLWSVALSERFPESFGDGPRSTPTVDGDLVFAVTSTMQLAALDSENGDELWRLDLLEEYGIQQPRFGFSPSVLAFDDLVILETGGGEGQAIMAFERETGDLVWGALDGPAGASSPLLLDLGGVPQLVFARRPDLIALSLDGETLWQHEVAPDVIVMPQFLPPDRFFLSSASMGPGGMMVQVLEEDGGFSTEALWVNRRMRNHFNNSVAVGEHLYGFDNSTLRCLDAQTGEICWSERGLGKGSVIAAGDRLFVLGDQGELCLVAATPTQYVELGRVQAMEGRCWTSPTLASGRLHLRNLEEMVVYDVRAAETDPEGLRVIAEPNPSEQGSAASAALPDLTTILQQYEAARGGLDRWREVQSLELRGTFSAFSESSPFTLRKGRPNLYRFDYGMVGSRDVRGRDASGPWWQYGLFGITEPARIEMAPYLPQLQREAMFEPALLGAQDKGIEVTLIGRGDLDGRPTVDLRLSFPDESVETWKLDPKTFLEVAVDSTVVDMTQAREPMDRRTFSSDFRSVDGLVLPFKVAMEFGARLEELVVLEAEVDPELPEGAFDMPAGTGTDGTEEDGPEKDGPEKDDTEQDDDEGAKEDGGE